MEKTMHGLVLFVAVIFLASPSLANDVPDGAKVFNKKCKICHAMDKKKMGPAVKTMNSDVDALRSAITNGQKSMPKFGHKLSVEEIDSLVGFIQAQKD